MKKNKKEKQTDFAEKLIHANYSSPTPPLLKALPPFQSIGPITSGGGGVGVKCKSN